MAAPDMRTAAFENTLLPALLQSLLSEIFSRTVLALVHRSSLLKESSSNSTITCAQLPADTRPIDINSKWVQECTARRTAPSIDEEKDSSERCRVSILDEVPAPETADGVPRQQFSEWLLVAKNKDDEDEEDDEDEDDEEDEDDDEGDDEEGDDDEEGADGGAAAGDGDEDDEEEDDDDDDEDEEDEDEDEDDDDEDESPPKKLRK